ncbi:MAG: hypothetical protein ABSF54_04530 [Bryobacteraceae bacterium]|jgi:hypothetical protein
MYCRATVVLAASMSAMALSAQTPAAAPQAPVIRPETERALREMIKKYSQGETAVCSIPLRAVPVAKNVERIPAVPPGENIDHMPSVKLPAPPCQEEKR